MEEKENVKQDKAFFDDSQKEAIAYFNKISQRLHKTSERPYNKKYDFASRSVFSNDYSIADIQKAINDLDVKTMREISNYYYSTSASYRRIIDTFANLYLYYYILDINGIEDFEKKSAMKLYNSCLRMLDASDIPVTFEKISAQILIEGAFFGYLSFNENDNGFVVTKLDPNFCRTRYYSAFGTRVTEFNVLYFNKYSDKDDLKNTLKSFPDSVQKTWKAYNSGKGVSNWAILPPEESCAFVFPNGVITPPLFDTIIDIINFNDYKDIEKKRDTQELEKLLIQKFKLDEDGDTKVLLEEIATIHEAVSLMLADKDNIEVLSSVADEIRLEDTQSTATTARNNIEKMLVPKYENAGLSAELFASTSSTSLESNLTNATSFMSQIVNNYSTWLSMILYSRFNFKKGAPIVEILPVTWFNRKKMSDEYLKDAQSGYSFILPYVASGKKQSTILSNKYLENNLLNLDTVLKPLNTSYTQSGSGSKVSEENPGNTKEEKTEKTIANIDSQ